jgi:hypothetical protein
VSRRDANELAQRARRPLEMFEHLAANDEIEAPGPIGYLVRASDLGSASGRVSLAAQRTPTRLDCSSRRTIPSPQPTSRSVRAPSGSASRVTVRRNRSTTHRLIGFAVRYFACLLSKDRPTPTPSETLGEPKITAVRAPGRRRLPAAAGRAGIGRLIRRCTPSWSTAGAPIMLDPPRSRAIRLSRARDAIRTGRPDGGGRPRSAGAGTE